MVSKKFSSIRPVGDSEMAETSLIGGPPQVAREALVLRCLPYLLGLSVFGLLCLIGRSSYCYVLESKIEAVVQPELKLVSATISLHELTSELTNIEWEVTLVARNPNTEIGLNCFDSFATILFGYDITETVNGGSLPNFFINNGTQNEVVISFKLGMVRWRNDPVVSTAASDLGRPAGSTTWFGLKISLYYTFVNDKMCSETCGDRMPYFWDHVTFKNKKELNEQASSGISFLPI